MAKIPEGAAAGIRNRIASMTQAVVDLTAGLDMDDPLTVKMAIRDLGFIVWGMDQCRQRIPTQSGVM